MLFKTTPIDTENKGIPDMKFVVPSIGSITHIGVVGFEIQRDLKEEGEEVGDSSPNIMWVG